MIGRYFFYLFLISVPFGLKALVFDHAVYAAGFFSPYASHFLYLSDIFLLFALILWGIEMVLRPGTLVFRSDFCSVLPFFILLLSVALSLFFAVDQFNSLIYLLRFFEFFLVFIFWNSNFVDQKTSLKLFVLVMLFLSLVGICQFLLQHSVGLFFLGEPNVSVDLLGVAKVELFGAKLMRAYATFSHPNVFAAYLLFAAFGLFYLDRLGDQFLKKYRFYIFSILAIALCLTFSRSALIALTVLLFLQVRLRLRLLLLALVPLFAYIAFDLTDLAVVERLTYLMISVKIFFANIFGVGWGNFTLVANDYTLIKLEPWSLQPVHNIFFLALAESGFFGFLALVFLFFRNFARFAWRFHFSLVFIIIVLVIGQFDHYFLSLYLGQFLFFWAFALITPKMPYSH